MDCLGQSDNNAPSYPLKLQVALRTQVDVFVFALPVSLSVLFQTRPDSLTQQQYLSYQQQFQHKKVEQVTAGQSLENIQMILMRLK